MRSHLASAHLLASEQPGPGGRRIPVASGAYVATEIADPSRMTVLPPSPATRPMIRFERARFADVEAEIAPLWAAHWAEIGQDRERVPLDPDLVKYRALDTLGMLEITAARRGSDLVGYVFSVVDTHLHYRSTLFAAQDLRYLAPACRGGRTALRLGQAHEAQLRARGVVKAFTNVKRAHDRDGQLFEHMGWKPVEILYTKVL